MRTQNLSDVFVCSHCTRYSFGFPGGEYGDLDADIEVVRELNASTEDQLTFAVNDVYETFASLNLRDQIRKGEDTPIQFLYEAAECRIFYTPDTIFNYTNLWVYATNAIFSNPSLCVQGSTGYASTGANPSNLMIPRPPPKDPTILNVSYDVDGIVALSGGADFGLPAAFSGKELDTVVDKVPSQKFTIDALQPAQKNPAPKGSRAGRLQPPSRATNQKGLQNTKKNNSNSQRPPKQRRRRRGMGLSSAGRRRGRAL